MRSLRYLNTVLTLIAVLLTAHLYVLWTSPGAPSLSSAAQAQDGGGIPNAGAQRAQIVDQLKRMNGQMDELKSLLRSGEARVRVEAGERK